MNKNQARDLFQLQTELIDAKVDMAVGKANDRVIAEIHGLKDEMHGFRIEVNNRFSDLEQRVTAVETTLGMLNETQREFRAKLLDYIFKGGWVALGGIASLIIFQLHGLIK